MYICQWVSEHEKYYVFVELCGTVFLLSQRKKKTFTFHVTWDFYEMIFHCTETAE